MKIIKFEKKENIKEEEQTRLMTFEDIPKKRVPNQYIVVEHRGIEDDYVIGYFDTEIEALKIYRRISHNDKNIYYGTAVYLTGCGIDIMYSYEDAEIIY